MDAIVWTLMLMAATWAGVSCFVAMLLGTAMKRARVLSQQREPRNFSLRPVPQPRSFAG
jgi:hypothetical protein